MMANLSKMRFQVAALLLCLTTACASPAANQNNAATPSASPSSAASASPNPAASPAASAAPSTGAALSKTQYLALLACYKASLGNSTSAVNAVNAHTTQVNAMTDAQFSQNLGTVFGASVKNYQDKANAAGCK